MRVQLACLVPSQSCRGSLSREGRVQVDIARTAGGGGQWPQVVVIACVHVCVALWICISLVFRCIISSLSTSLSSVYGTGPGRPKGKLSRLSLSSNRCLPWEDMRDKSFSIWSYCSLTSTLTLSCHLVFLSMLASSSLS